MPKSVLAFIYWTLASCGHYEWFSPVREDVAGEALYVYAWALVARTWARLPRGVPGALGVCVNQGSPLPNMVDRDVLHARAW